MDENLIIPGVDDLPLFATEEARIIHEDNRNKEDAIKNADEVYNDLRERVKVMKDHHSNVEQEVQHTNQLVTSKMNEIRAEKHAKQLSSRALARSQQETKQLQDEITLVQGTLNRLQNDIYKANENMDELKLKMNWTQDDLEKWALAARQKEDDNMALQKYTRADELKIKELNQHLEQLTKELFTMKAKLESEVTETQAKQMELDRVALEFKELHNERQQCLQQWQQTVNEMRDRDSAINELGERFAAAQQQRAQQEAKVALQNKRLLAQQNENKEVVTRTDTLSRIVARKREEMLSSQTKLQEFRDELESLKNELTSAAETLVTLRNKNSHTSQSMEEKRVQLERQRQKYQVVKTKLEKAKNATNRAEVTAKEVEDKLAATEKDYNTQLNALKKLKETLFRKAQSLHDSKTEETRLRSEISGIKSAARNLDVQLSLLDKEAARQQELLYNAEFQIQQIERKIARGMGERSDDEKRALKALIEQSEIDLEKAKEKKKMLQQQNRKLLNELAGGRNRREDLTNQKSVLTEKMGELELENKMIEEEMKKSTKSKEELCVLNDLLRLEVRRLTDLLSGKADTVYSLENRKQQMILSMQERKQEIIVHMELLKAELRGLEEEKHKIMLDLKTRETAVDKLKARFEATAAAKGGNDESHSQAYYIILSAQKREELQRKGDELDHSIRMCEKEIRTMQLTLDHLNARNQAYRASFQKVDLKGDDGEVLKQLEERTKLGKEALFRKKKDLQRLVTDFEEDSRRLEQIKGQTGRIFKQKEHLETAKREIEDEILLQQAQLSELADRIGKIASKHRMKAMDTTGASDMSAFQNGTLEEKAVRAEVLKDVVQVRVETGSLFQTVRYSFLSYTYIECAIYYGTIGCRIPRGSRCYGNTVERS